MARRPGGPKGFGGVPQNTLKNLRESTFRPSRSPREPKGGSPRGRQPLDRGGRHARRALGTSNVRLLHAPVGDSDVVQESVVAGDYEAPAVQPLPHGRAGVSWAYGLRPPNGGAGADDRGAYLKGPEIGSLLLTVHSPKSPHSQSLRRAGKSPRKTSFARSDVLGSDGAELSLSSGHNVNHQALMRKKAQADLWKNKVDSCLQMLHERMNSHPSLARMFKLWDDDGSGYLSREEISRALGQMNVVLDPCDMDAVFMYFDSDGSGEVNSHEFLDAIRNHEPPHELGRSMLKQTRRESVEEDIGDGRDEDDVNAGKLSHAMHHLRHKFQNAKSSQLYALLRQYDVDNDGYIDADELKSILTMLSVPLTKAEVLVLMNTEFVTDDENRIRYDAFINRLQDPRGREWDQTFVKFERMYKDRTAKMTNSRMTEERERIKGKAKFRVAAVDLAPKLVAILKQNMARIMHAFKRFDTNGDGVLDKEEFAQLLGKFAEKNDDLGITKQDIDMMFHFFDKDGGGTLEMEEMVHALFELRGTEVAGKTGEFNVGEENSSTLNAMMGSASNIDGSAWARGKDGKLHGDSSSRVTIFAPAAQHFTKEFVATARNVNVDPVNHIHAYRDRRQHLRQRHPNPEEYDYIKTSVVYNPQNVGRQMLLKEERISNVRQNQL